MILSCRPEDGRGCQNAVPYCGLPHPLTTTLAQPPLPYDLSPRKSPAFSRRRHCRHCHRSHKHTGEEMRARARRLLANLIYRHRSGLLHGIYPRRAVYPSPPSYIAFLEPPPDLLLICVYTVRISCTRFRCGENNFVILFLYEGNCCSFIFTKNSPSCYIIYLYLGVGF